MTAPLNPADPTAPILDRIARALGPGYEILRELGGGGMARVFVVRDNTLRRQLALKVFAPERSGAMSGERFRREILTVAQLQHPNIVPLLSTGDADGVPYFLMPFIEGASLRAAIGGKGMAVRSAVRVLTDVVRALAYAHGAGVVHRDIKPDNILLAGDTAVVTDFGVAKAVSIALGPESGGVRAVGTSPLTLTGMSFGTPVYMAPEQVAADPAADHRVDFYALGVTAYEMLCGTAPFHGDSPRALLTAKLTRMPQRITTMRPDVSPQLEAIVMRCLAVDADKRPATAAEILDALGDPAVLSTGVVALSGGMLRNTIAHRLTRRRVALAVMAIVGIGAVGTAWTMRSNAEARAHGAVARGAVAQGVTVPPAAAANDSVARTPAALDARGITVVPFVDLAATDDSARFATSLSESVRNGLAATSGFRIAATSVTVAALQTGGDVRDVARRLGTAWVLTGTIDREGSALRLSVQLVSAEDGLSVWATTIDGDRGRRFDFEKRAAQEIADAVAGAVDGAR